MSDTSSVAATLLRTLDEATAADLASVDQEIASARGKLAVLEQLRKLLATRLNGPAERKLSEERRRQIVEYLARRGPRTGGDICLDPNIPTGSITGLLDHPWFLKTTQGVHITPLARREVLDT